MITIFIHHFKDPIHIEDHFIIKLQIYNNLKLEISKSVLQISQLMQEKLKSSIEV